MEVGPNQRVPTNSHLKLEHHGHAYAHDQSHVKETRATIKPHCPSEVNEDNCVSSVTVGARFELLAQEMAAFLGMPPPIRPVHHSKMQPFSRSPGFAAFHNSSIGSANFVTTADRRPYASHAIARAAQGTDLQEQGFRASTPRTSTGLVNELVKDVCESTVAAVPTYSQGVVAHGEQGSTTNPASSTTRKVVKRGQWLSASPGGTSPRLRQGKAEGSMANAQKREEKKLLFTAGRDPKPERSSSSASEPLRSIKYKQHGSDRAADGASGSYHRENSSYKARDGVQGSQQRVQGLSTGRDVSPGSYQREKGTYKARDRAPGSYQRDQGSYKARDGAEGSQQRVHGFSTSRDGSPDSYQREKGSFKTRDEMSGSNLREQGLYKARDEVPGSQQRVQGLSTARDGALDSYQREKDTYKAKDVVPGSNQREQGLYKARDGAEGSQQRVHGFSTARDGSPDSHQREKDTYTAKDVVSGSNLREQGSYKARDGVQGSQQRVQGLSTARDGALDSYQREKDTNKAKDVLSGSNQREQGLYKARDGAEGSQQRVHGFSTARDGSPDSYQREKGSLKARDEVSGSNLREQGSYKAMDGVPGSQQRVHGSSTARDGALDSYQREKGSYKARDEVAGSNLRVHGSSTVRDGALDSYQREKGSFKAKEGVSGSNLREQGSYKARDGAQGSQQRVHGSSAARDGAPGSYQREKGSYKAREGVSGSNLREQGSSTTRGGASGSYQREQSLGSQLWAIETNHGSSNAAEALAKLRKADNMEESTRMRYKAAGGKRKQSDAGPEATAAREAEEESHWVLKVGRVHPEASKSASLKWVPLSTLSGSPKPRKSLKEDSNATDSSTNATDSSTNASDSSTDATDCSTNAADSSRTSPPSELDPPSVASGTQATPASSNVDAAPQSDDPNLFSGGGGQLKRHVVLNFCLRAPSPVMEFLEQREDLFKKFVREPSPLAYTRVGLNKAAALALAGPRPRLAKVGDIVRGIVTNILPSGAFVEVPGIPGNGSFIHVSVISASHVVHPSRVFKVGEVIKAKLICVDARGGHTSLSTRVLESHPGDMLKYPQLVYASAPLASGERAPRVGDIVSAVVLEWFPTGATMQVSGLGAPCLLTVDNMSQDQIEKVHKVLKKGDTIKATLLGFINGEGKSPKLSTKDLEELDIIKR
eukprot:gene8243-1512_t